MISQREIWDHKTSLTPLPSQESEHVVIYIHVCVKGVDFASLFLFGLGGCFSQFTVILH